MVGHMFSGGIKFISYRQIYLQEIVRILCQNFQRLCDIFLSGEVDKILSKNSNDLLKVTPSIYMDL